MSWDKKKKFVLENVKGEPGAYQLVGRDGSLRHYVGEDTAPIFRASPDVEDRTRSDWSDVPVGTAGTATVRGVEGRALRTGESSWVVIRPDGLFEELFNGDITDFTPDRVVDEVLIGNVEDALYAEFGHTGLSAYGRALRAVDQVLQGQS